MSLVYFCVNHCSGLVTGVTKHLIIVCLTASAGSLRSRKMSGCIKAPSLAAYYCIASRDILDNCIFSSVSMMYCGTLIL